jgi:hypothetical protein
VEQRTADSIEGGLVETLARLGDLERPLRCSTAVSGYTPDRSLVEVFRQYQAWEDAYRMGVGVSGARE